MLEGKPYKLTAGKIDRINQKEHLVVSTGPLTCEGSPAPNDVFFEIYVSAGPDGKHYAPGPVGVAAMLVRGAGSDGPGFVMGGAELHGVLTLEPGDWAPGNKVKGSLRIDDISEDKKATYTGSSPFEATVCELAADPEADLATPAEADKGPASGTLGGAAFTAKSAIAILSHDARRDVDQIDEIHLFDSEVDCTTYQRVDGTVVRITGTAGASGKDVFVGAPQPRDLWWGANFHLQGPAWVKFDAIELKEGAEVKGSVYGEATAARAKKYPKSAGKLSGTFTAKVCK